MMLGDLAAHYRQEAWPRKPHVQESYTSNMRYLEAKWNDITLVAMASDPGKVGAWLNNLTSYKFSQKLLARQTRMHKRMFYSGDLRSHGRKEKLFENLVQRPIRDIDVLFLECTMLHRNNDLFTDETAVENAIFQTIQRQKNISFLLSSSQDIDRIVSACVARKNAGQLLVIDIYTAWVLEQLWELTRSTPAMDRPTIRVFATHSQDEKLKATPDYFGDFRKGLYRHRVKREELHATPKSFLCFGKMSSFRLIDEFKSAAAPVNVIYSQCLSYLDENHADYFGSDRISACRRDPAVNLLYAHASGYTSVPGDSAQLLPQNLAFERTPIGEPHRICTGPLALPVSLRPNDSGYSNPVWVSRSISHKLHPRQVAKSVALTPCEFTSVRLSSALLSKLLAGLPAYPPQYSVRTRSAEANQASVCGEKTAARRRANVRSPNARYTSFSPSTAAEPRPP